MILSNFFLTKGKAVSGTSELNAFDSALREAKIDQCNLVQVSSILPENAKEVDPITIEPGNITFCVLSKMDGFSGDTIASGVGYAQCEGERKKYGLVAEDHGYKNPEFIKDELKRKLEEMAQARGMEIGNVKLVVEGLSIPKQKYGSTVVALVYTSGE